MSEVVSSVPVIGVYEKPWNELSIDERRTKIQLAEDYRLRGYYPKQMTAEVIAERIYSNTRNKLLRQRQSDG